MAGAVGERGPERQRLGALALGAAERGLDTIIAEGSLRSQVESMQTRADLYDLVDYAAYNEFDTSVFNFDVERDNYH